MSAGPDTVGVLIDYQAKMQRELDELADSMLVMLCMSIALSVVVATIAWRMRGIGQ